MGSHRVVEHLIAEGLSPKKEIMSSTFHECSMDGKRPYVATRTHHVPVLVEDLSMYERWRLFQGRSRGGHPMQDYENHLFFVDGKLSQRDNIIIPDHLEAISHSSFGEFLKAVGYNGKSRTYAVRNERPAPRRMPWPIVTMNGPDFRR